MRTLFIAFLAVLVAIPAISQIPDNAVALEDASFNTQFTSAAIPKVTGKILNLPADQYQKTLITYSLVTPFAKRQHKKTTTPSQDGSFTLQIDYPFPYQQIWLSVGDFYYAGIYANKDLYVELDFSKISPHKEVNFNGDGVEYLGSDGAFNSFMNNYILYKREDQLRLSKKMYNLANKARSSQDDCVASFDSLFDSIKQIDDSYLAANPSPYGWVLENERMSEYYGQLCTAHWGKVIKDSLWQKIKQHKSYLVSNNSTDYYDYMLNYIKINPANVFETSWKDIATLPDLSLQEKALIDSLRTSEKKKGSSPYTTANIKKWSQQLSSRTYKFATEKRLSLITHQLDSIFPPAKADFLKLALNTTNDLSEEQSALRQLTQSMHTFWCATVANNQYEQVTARVKEINQVLAASANNKQPTTFGTPIIQTPYGASLYKASPGITATDFLAMLKQHLPGKAIIIDRWATWCAPCIGEMPHSKSLQLASGDLPVAFVYLCTMNGSSEAQWKSKVIELEQPGLHFLIDEKLDAAISSYFSFSGYPGYAFIDKSGKYKPGAFSWLSEIENKEKLAALINN